MIRIAILFVVGFMAVMWAGLWALQIAVVLAGVALVGLVVVAAVVIAVASLPWAMAQRPAIADQGEPARAVNNLEHVLWIRAAAKRHRAAVKAKAKPSAGRAHHRRHGHGWGHLGHRLHGGGFHSQ